MDDMTPEQAALLDLLQRVEDLEITVQHLRAALAVQMRPTLLAIPQPAPIARRLTANPDRVRTKQ